MLGEAIGRVVGDKMGAVARQASSRVGEQAASEPAAKVFALRDRTAFNGVLKGAKTLSPQDIQGHVDRANGEGRIDLAYMFGSLKFAKQIWDDLAFWTRKAPDPKAGEVLLSSANSAMAPNLIRLDVHGPANMSPRRLGKLPDELISQDELLSGVVGERARELGLRYDPSHSF